MAPNESSSSSLAHSSSYYKIKAIDSNDSCISWLSFLRGDFTLSSIPYNPVRMAVSNYFLPTKRKVIFSCSVSSVVQEMVSFLLPGSTPPRVMLQRYCNGYNWTVYSCSGTTSLPSICIGCPSDPCADAAIIPRAKVNPCESDPNRASILAIRVDYSYRQPPPSILELTTTATNTSVLITGTLSSSGEMYCGVFNTEELAHLNPSSLSERIIFQNNFASSNSQNIVQLIVSGLKSLTAYRTFCITKLFGATLTVGDVQSQSTSFSTACCKVMLVKQSVSVKRYSQNILSFLKFTIDSLPSSSLVLSASIRTPNSSVDMKESFFPRQLMVDSSYSADSSGNILLSMSLSNSLPLGCYLYSLTLSGPSASEYVIFHNPPMTKLCVVAEDYIPVAPALVSAGFSNDGTHIQIQFDSPTNRAGSSSTFFFCWRLFEFSCSFSSQCQWIDDQTIYAFVSSTRSCRLPVPGSSVMIQPTAAIKAACPNTNSLCTAMSTWPNATRSTIIIKEPSFATPPIVVITMPSSVGFCDPLSLDVTSSTGNGGRPWASAAVVAKSSCGNTSSLNKFLNQTFAAFPPTSIPPNYFQGGCSYAFIVQLCSFLGACSTSSESLTILDSITPIVNIPGSAVRSINRGSLLRISSVASVSPCANAQSKYSLMYSWTVSQNNIDIINIVSVSKDPTTFVLPPYSLASNSYYKVKFTATIKETLMSSSTSVSVFVQQGKLVSVITGGLFRNIQSLRTIMVDASSSYDEDKNGVTGTTAGLAFSWSCIQTSPVLNQSCLSIIRIVSVGSIATVFANAVGVDSAGQLTVQVSDMTSTRVSQAVVYILVLSNSSAAVINVDSNVPSSVIPSSQTLQLTGTISVAQHFLSNNSYFRWSINDPTVDLQAVAVSPVQGSLSQMRVTSYLVIPPYKLIGGTILTFTLSCYSSKSSSIYYAIITITVNSPPQPGVFQVTPTVGVELVTSFLFSALQWTTFNYPLNYQFGYRAQKGTDITIQSKSLQAYVSALLPASAIAQNFTVPTFSYVWDALNSNSSAYTTVVVRKSNVVSYDQLLSLASGAQGQSIDTVKQSNGLVISLLNAVNCSQAPNCSTLHRAPCGGTSHTCGNCLSDDFIGDYGDSNTMCIPHIFLIRPRTCLITSDCVFNEVCLNGACRAPLKRCTADCSGHGQCQFINANIGSIITECRERDSSCTAQCVCEPNYFGTALCDMNSTELQGRIVLRSKLMKNVGTLVSTEYPSIEALRDWTNLLSETASNPDELNSTSSNYVLNISQAILRTGKSLGSDSSSVLNLLAPIDAATSAIGKGFGTRGNGTAVLSLLQLCGSVISSTMSPSQYAIQSIQSQFRISVAALSSGIGASLSLPQNVLEVFSEIQPSKLNIQGQGALTTNGISATAIMIRSTLSSPLASGKQYDTNPVVLSLSSLPCTSSRNSSDCAVDFFLPHVDTRSILASQNLSEKFTVLCRKNVRSSVTHNCSDGYSLSVKCNGSFAGKLNSFCPIIKQRTICSSYGDGYGSCSLLKSTIKETVCRCHFQSSRRLTESDGGQQSIGAVTILQTFADNIQMTSTSAASLDADVVSKQYTVLVTIGTLALAILVAFYAAQKADAEESVLKDFKSFGSMQRKETTSKGVEHIELVRRNRLNGPRSKKVASHDESRDDLTIWEESLPRIFSSQPFSERLYAEMKQHHRWLGIVFYYSESLPRPLRVLALSTKIILMLFVQSLTYDFTSPDDGSCGLMKTQFDCLQQKSPFATGQSECAWQDGLCSFVQPSDNFKIILYVAIFSTLISTPIEYMLNKIIRVVLARPLKTSKVAADINQNSDHTLEITNGALSTESPEVLERFDRLSQAIQDYRQRLTPEKCSEFDGKLSILWFL